jgi:FkbM family methyltransferase
MKKKPKKKIDEKLIIRIISLVKRLFTCSSILGFINSVKIIIYPILINRIDNIQFNKKKFYFYTKHDQGVMSHFYSKNYYIKEGLHSKIKYILDLGANIGVETFRFAEFYPDSKIISVEPFERNFKILKKNFKNYKNVFLINKPIWSSKKFLIPNIVDNSFENIVYSEIKNDSSILKKDNLIESTTIQNIFEEYNLPYIDVLKMDCEGSEKIFFNNLSKNILEKIKCIIIEVSDDQNELMMQSVLQKFIEIDFRFYIVGEDIILIRNDSDLSCHAIYGLETI